MDLEQIIKETVAKIVAEKELTAAEEKKREEIVKAMKKDFKGPAPAMYAIATDKAKKLAEDGLNEDYEVAMAQDSLDSIIRAAMMLKTQMGDKEINLPAWIQDHITNSENYIYQAAKGYHESDAQMDDKAGAEEMNEGYNFEQSAIESASGDKITGTEEDDYGNTLYIGQDPYDQYFIVNGEIKHDNFQKGIKSVTIGMLKHYGDGQNHSANDDMYESFQPKSSFDDFKIGDSAMLADEKVKILNMKMDDESGERRARVRFEDGSAKEVSINSLEILDESKELDEWTIRRMQHYAGIK
jgi:hypothetical protein